MDEEAETQAALAHQLYVTQWHGEILHECRALLGLKHRGAVEGPLKGILTARRLRRCENGQEDVPPRAWSALADMLEHQGQHITSAPWQARYEALRPVIAEIVEGL
jgi:hypothetical protein